MLKTGHETGHGRHYGDMTVESKGNNAQLVRENGIMLRCLGQITIFSCTKACVEGALLSPNNLKLMQQLGAIDKVGSAISQLVP